MHPGHHRAPANAAVAAGGFDFSLARAGLAVVFCAASFLLSSTAGGETAVTVPADAGSEWQLVLAFAALAAGSLCLMRGMGMGPRDARLPPAHAVRRNAAAPDPERLMPSLLIFLLFPCLEAW